MKENKPIEISIVVPVHNEQDNLALLYERISRVMHGRVEEYELVFVDDGSTDNTEKILRRLSESDSRLAMIVFRKNFGQTAALAAGFKSARGNIVIAMDGDLQDDPAEIPRFLEKIAEGYDVVSGWRAYRTDNFITRRLPSLVASKMMSLISGVKIHDFGSTFKAYRKIVLDNIELSSDLHRFIPALAALRGFRISEIKIKRNPRASGRSHYGLSRILPVLYDFFIVKFLTSYFSKPMKVFGFLGIVTFVTGFVIGLWLALGYYFYGMSIRENYGNVVLCVLLMLIGLQFLFTGILAELFVRIYRRVSGKKIYFIKEVNTRRAIDITY